MNYTRPRALLLFFSGSLGLASNAGAQAPETASDATVTYPAEYFAQFNPYSVNDMLQRIPGISLARSGSPPLSAPWSHDGWRWRRRQQPGWGPHPP